jgi:hypothetical protein
MTPRSRTGCLALLSLAACSPDLSLLSDRASFAGASSGGENAVTSGGGGSAGSSGVGASVSAGGATNETTGGDGAENPHADAGAAGATPEPCVATGTERCNEKDDDCNGVIDDGCPGGLTTVYEKDLPAIGDSAGGAVFTDDCKDGEVLGGVTVAMGAFLSQARGVCRSLSLELSANAPNGYRIVLASDRALSPHPATSTDAVTALACPENEALVGLRTGQQHYTLADNSVVPVTSRVWLTCAKLVLVDHDGTLAVSWEGPKELAPASGGIANGTAFLVSSSAPEGLVATRLLGASGNWIDRIGFGVSRIDVVLR